MSELLTFSASESQRFGHAVFRGDVFAPEKRELFFSECMKKSADIVILRGNVEQAIILHAALLPVSHVIWADTLIEFRKVLNENTCADLLGSGTEISEAVESDRASLVNLIERCYAEYKNHYHANPCLDEKVILSGLVEYSLSFLAGNEKTIFIARQNGRPVGYLCMDFDRGVGSNPIGGSALDIPMSLRHKVLCDLTHHGDLWLMKKNIRRFRAFTRTDKVYIQKLLIHNMHCLPASTLGTLHVNLFLQRMHDAKPIEWPPGFAPDIAAVHSTDWSQRPPKGEIWQKAFRLNTHSAEYAYYGSGDAAGIFRLRSARRFFVSPTA